MKIINANTQDDILKRLCALQIMLNAYMKDIEAYGMGTENIAYIACAIGGTTGAYKVKNTVWRKDNDI